MGAVAVILEEVAQRARASIVGEQAGEHEDRMAVTARRQRQPGAHHAESAELRQGPALEEEQRLGGRRHRFANRHPKNLKKEKSGCSWNGFEPQGPQPVCGQVTVRRRTQQRRNKGAVGEALPTL